MIQGVGGTIICHSRNPSFEYYCVLVDFKCRRLEEYVELYKYCSYGISLAIVGGRWTARDDNIQCADSDGLCRIRPL